MKAFLLPILGVVFASSVFSLSPSASAQLDKAGMSEAEAKTLMQKQVASFEQIQVYVERIDLARLLVIKGTAQATLDSLNENGLGHMRTIRAFQNLIVQYRFSRTFFTEIRAEVIASTIDQVLADGERIAQAFGFDDSPYTQITANSFRQIQKLLAQLDGLPLDATLKAELRALWPAIGNVIAIAEQGDRPRAFDAAKAVALSVRRLYPRFDAILASDRAFMIVMETQGLIEFYAEFAQMD